jgi:hypothetical protein
MILVLIVLLIISGITTLPFALEPLLTHKNWHIFLPWYAFFSAFGMVVAPLLFIGIIPSLTIKSGIILGIATIGCMVVLFVKLLTAIVALGKEAIEYTGNAHIEVVSRPFGIHDYYLLLDEATVAKKLSITPLVALRFKENDVYVVHSITCSYLPFFDRIFRITVHTS